jgi:hypothetical protein
VKDGDENAVRQGVRTKRRSAPSQSEVRAT